MMVSRVWLWLKIMRNASPAKLLLCDKVCFALGASAVAALAKANGPIDPLSLAELAVAPRAENVYAVAGESVLWPANR